MKYLIALVIFSFLISTIQAQVKTYHTNGAVKETGSYNNQGLKTGVWTSYYPSGTTYSISTWKGNSRDWLLFYDNGYLRESGSYTNERKTGEWLKYDSKGCLTSIGTLKDNAYTGERRRYHSGKLAAIEHYKDRKKSGKWLWYRDGDRLHQEQNYLNGEAHGESKSFFKNGNLIYQRLFDKGKPIGTHKEYYESGAIKIVSTFTNGKSAEIKNYYESGSISAKRTFVEDIILANSYYEIGGKLGSVGFNQNTNGTPQIGKWKYYHQNGKLKYKGKYVEGKRVGKWKGWHSHGKRKFKGNYKDGEKVGVWRNYDEKGKLMPIEN